MPDAIGPDLIVEAGHVLRGLSPSGAMVAEGPSALRIEAGRIAEIGPLETVTLSHHAQDRQIFARGAIKAALWARDKAPGLYSMDDVLGLTD